MEPFFHSRAKALPIAVAAALLATPPLAAAELPKRTLAELLQLARERAPTIPPAEAQVALRQAQRAEALSNWLPRGEITGTLTLSTTLRCEDEMGRPTTQNCVRTNVSNVYSATPSGVGGEINLSLIQPVYTFGKIEHGTKAAEYGIEAEKQRVEMARREAELQVTRAYWGLKAARAALGTSEDARKDLAEWVDKIEKDLDKEKPQYNFSLNDLQRLKVAVSVVDVVIADMQRNAGIAQQGLRVAIGEATDIDDSDLDPVELVQKPMEYYETEALANRPEVHALDAGVSAKRELAKLKIAEMLPDIALAGNVGYRNAMNVDDPQNAFMNHYAPGPIWGGGIGFRQPMDLFIRYQRLQQARADAQAMEAERRLALTGIDFEIAQAYENLGEARRRLAAADKGQSLARGWFTAVKQDLDVGTGDARDLVDAARNYYELRLRYYQAIYDFNFDVAVLRKASGVDIAK